MQEQQNGVGPAPRFCIVVALDDSNFAEAVLEHALDQAGRYAQPDLHFLTVEAPVRRFGSSDIVNSPDAARKFWLRDVVSSGLETFARARPETSTWRVRLYVRVGDVVEEIVGMAADLRAELLIVGRFGEPDVKPKDSVTNQVVQESPCPVLVVPLAEHGAPQSVAQCPACVAVRRESHGERWFCEAHTASGDRALSTRASVLLPRTSSGMGGGPLW